MMQNISELIAHPEKLTDNLVLHELRELIAAHPYYHVARLLYLRALYLNHDQSFGEELRRAAFYVSDRRVLFRLIEGDYYTLKPVLKKKKIQDAKEEGADRTQVLIDAFLNALPASENEGEGEFSPLDNGVLGADYASYMLREEDFHNEEQGETEEEGTQMTGQELIDEFIKNADNRGPLSKDSTKDAEVAEQTEDLSPIEDDESYFTETLAKIYIKQHRYAKALEIIRRLSLKYPKKNAYFADQIRFLEKIIKNSTE